MLPRPLAVCRLWWREETFEPDRDFTEAPDRAFDFRQEVVLEEIWDLLGAPFLPPRTRLTLFRLARLSILFPLS